MAPEMRRRGAPWKDDHYAASVGRVSGICAWLLPAAIASFACMEDARASPSAQLVYARGLGAEQCPDGDALRRAVAARLGFDPFFSYAKQVIIAEIGAAKKGFRGRVRVLDEAGRVRGERVVESASNDCAEMVRAMALGISI